MAVRTPYANTFRVINILLYLQSSFFNSRQYPAQDNAADIVSRSPSGLIPNCFDPVSTTIATPINAIAEPVQSRDFMESWKMTFPKMIVNIGAQQIIKETFEANVMPSAVFSAMKYSDPPVMPVASINISSFKEAAHNMS